MTQPEEEKTNVAIEDPKQIIQSELDDTYRALKEITLMLEQSRVELGKLTQRNAAVTAHMQQVQSQIDKLPREEVKTAYDSALDAQQRLFVMRGQLEKLQSDQTHLEQYKSMLERLKTSTAAGGAGGPGKPDKGGMAGVEMLVNAQEAERQRLSRQMHDGPAQALSNFILQTEIAMRLLDVDPAQARSELSNLKVAAMSTFQKVRNFIFELRPMMLDDLGLAPTIRRYADTFKEQAGVEVSITISGNERRLESYIEVMVFRSMQELLSSAVHQNQATLVKIQVDIGDTTIRLSLDDNGKGFDTDSLEKESNLGLKLIRDRVEMLGGKFEIDSAPGKGARVTLTIPVHS
ncbi:MAG TPA: sensor histidine kinase [Anaerolineales bacterium]|nr:sensor histidine kinase [Anaerolineales bacterium]